MAKRYDELVRRFGYDYRACDWGSSASQQRRFEVLAAVADLNGRSVLDVGCGLADFATYLSSAEGRSGVPRYTGLDISQEMIRHARERGPDLDIRQGNILDDGLETFDIVVGSGIFTLLPGERCDLVESIIAAMYDHANHAVAFNTLSSWTSHRRKDEFHASPIAMLEFCRSLTERLVLRHDYHPRDFTVYLYRPDA